MMSRCSAVVTDVDGVCSPFGGQPDGERALLGRCDDDEIPHHAANRNTRPAVIGPKSSGHCRLRGLFNPGDPMFRPAPRSDGECGTPLN